VGVALVSIVIPVYNERECLPALFDRLVALAGHVDEPLEYIFVNDGSTDGSDEILRDIAGRADNVRLITFSRNFGHEAATTAGVDHAAGDAVVIIDADLQDPPEVIVEMLARWRAGAEVVYAQRRARAGERLTKRLSSWLFYRIIARLSEVHIPVDTGDFRLMDARVAAELRRCRETSRFVRGLVAWTGFRQEAVPYDRDPRHGGQTKYDLGKLILLALDAVVGFSIKPLRVTLAVGLGVVAVALSIAAVIVIQKLFFGMPFQGYALLSSGMFLLGGVQILLIGLLGEYVGRLYRQGQNRPLYVIRDKSPSLPAGPEGLAGQSAAGREESDRWT
jgi:dolichol-phosphate mannosyltransferase